MFAFIGIGITEVILLAFLGAIVVGIVVVIVLVNHNKSKNDE